MRESFGGAFMIKLVLVFIVIYITFMGVAVEYAKVFRVKNQVINILEQSQYTIKDDTVKNSIDQYLSKVPYNNSDESVKNKCVNSLSSSSNEYVFTDNGICIEEFKEGINAHFKVTAYIHIVFPFFGLDMTMPISGETKTIRY